MTEKEFRRLSRAELVDIIYELQKREKAQQEELAVLRKKLEERELRMADAGNLAEAAIGLNDVFGRAQSAADQYLKDAEARAEKILQEAEMEREAVRRQTEEDLEKRLQAFQQDLRRIIRSYPELERRLDAGTDDPLL